MRTRRSWGRVRPVIDLPYLLQDQKRSYEWFLTEGIAELIREISPIKGEGREGLELELKDPRLAPPPYSEQDCKDKNLTYAATLRVKGILKQNGKKIKEDDLYLADIPLMTARGTFIINGSENALVNHLTRSPGVYFTKEGPTEYRAQILPDYGAWLEFVLDTKKERVTAQLDRKGNIPPTVLLRALGYTTADIYKLYSVVLNPITAEKLSRFVDCIVTEPIGNGKVIVREGERLTADLIEQIVALNPSRVYCLDRYIQRSLDEDKTTSAEMALELIYRKLRGAERPTQKTKQDFFINLFFNPETFSLSRVGRFMVNKKLGLNRPEHDTVLHKEEIALTLKRLLGVPTNPLLIDDKDHLANKRVETPGETAYNRLREGLRRMARLTQDRLSKSTLEEEEEPLRNLISGRIVQSALNKLFYVGRLSQFLEQTNPLTELTHKRRLSALGGSMSKRRAKIEVRDVHPSHYDRICPIETPEGQNIGLITSMATYARINEYGFLEAPYRVVKNGKATNEIKYLMADEEEHYKIAPATVPLDKDGKIIPKEVEIRTGRENIRIVPREEVDFLEVSPAALVSVSASLIPFLEHDDSNRALMGANMQRQAVPLLKPQAPYVGTGIEAKVARDSGMLVIAEEDGVVSYVDAQKIVVKSGRKERTYHLITFDRSNQDTLVHQRPIVTVGQKVQKGEVLADGPATDHGELALGANVSVCFLPLKGITTRTPSSLASGWFGRTCSILFIFKSMKFAPKRRNWAPRRSLTTYPT